MVALEKLQCIPVHFTVAAKITVHTVKCTGTRCNFSSATMNYANVTMNYPNAVFCVQLHVRN